MTPRWLANWDEAGRRRADRLAGREVDRSPFEDAPEAGIAVPHWWVEDWAPTPSLDRSVHMRPAETQHPEGDRKDSAVARSVRWLVGKLL